MSSSPASSAQPIHAASGLVTLRLDGSLAQVRLDRPDKLNALTLQSLRQLVETARRIRRDPAVRAVVVAGEGDSFCAGLDIKTVLGDPAGLAAGFLPVPWRRTNLFQEACWAWRRLDVPVIAAVHGHCYGAGLQLALAADLRITAPDASWSVMEGRWGLVPDMTGVATLRELVGIETAKRLTWTAEVISGREAHRLGLAGEVADDPVAAATELAGRLAQRSPRALAGAKRLFTRGWQSSPHAVLARERLEQARILVRGRPTIATTRGESR